MKLSIIKRIVAIENIVQQPSAVPSLIMISYNSTAKEWKIVELYERGQGKQKTFKEKQHTAKNLKDYIFPADGNPHIIIDTFGNPDPNIYENLFSFDLKELQEDLKAGGGVSISIETIKEPEEGSIVAEIVAYINERKQ